MSDTWTDIHEELSPRQAWDKLVRAQEQLLVVMTALEKAKEMHLEGREDAYDLEGGSRAILVHVKQDIEDVFADMRMRNKG